MQRRILDAGLAGAVLSGVTFTACTLARREDLLEGARAAGAIILPRETRTPVLLAAAVPVHLALSLGWAAVLDRALPRPPRPTPGILAGRGRRARPAGSWRAWVWRRSIWGSSAAGSPPSARSRSRASGPITSPTGS